MRKLKGWDGQAIDCCEIHDDAYRELWEGNGGSRGVVDRGTG